MDNLKIFIRIKIGYVNNDKVMIGTHDFFCFVKALIIVTITLLIMTVLIKEKSNVLKCSILLKEMNLNLKYFYLIF